MFTSDDLSSLRWNSDIEQVEIIDQTRLPHELKWVALDSLDAYCEAIASMRVRGAPLIGITAAFGLAHAVGVAPQLESIEKASATLLATRPTAVNLRWALQIIGEEMRDLPEAERGAAALELALRLRDEDIANCEQIGEHGLELLRACQRGDTLNVMTHCNAGWLATIQWGTALAPIYKAHQSGIDVHVWVSETRPRNQGTNLTAWELQRAGLPCTIVVDNGCGHLMREGKVDCVIVGSDRTAANGDVCNKIGTYLKALAAEANDVPFFVALPESTIDWSANQGADIPIEERSADEVLTIAGLNADKEWQSVHLAGPESIAHNPAFDVTPAALVNALITEYGSYPASAAGLGNLRAKLAASDP